MNATKLKFVLKWHVGELDSAHYFGNSISQLLRQPKTWPGLKHCSWKVGVPSNSKPEPVLKFSVFFFERGIR